MSIQELTNPNNNYELYVNNKKSSFNQDMIFNINQTIPSGGGPITQQSILEFVTNGATLKPSAVKMVYRYDGGVLGSGSCAITNQAKTETYWSVTFPTSGVQFQLIEFTKGVDVPASETTLFFHFSIDASWNHASDSIRSLSFLA